MYRRFFAHSGRLAGFVAKHVLLSVACLALGSVPAFAQVTYTYTGHPFTLFSCGPSNPGPGTIDCSTPAPANPDTSYTATDFVSGTLTLSSPLPANLPYQDIRTFPGFQITLNDGQHTVTNAEALGWFAEVSTDGNGNINSWRFVLNTGGVDDGGISTINAVINGFDSVIDQGTLACCDPNPPGNLALNLSMPGTWTSSNTPPSPSAAVSSLENMVANPLLGLSNGQISSLNDKLNNALISINANQNKQAINQLNAFISSVQTTVKTGKMSTQTANTLTNAANAIIQML